jgi:hypothetical protein
MIHLAGGWTGHYDMVFILLVCTNSSPSICHAHPVFAADVRRHVRGLVTYTIATVVPTAIARATAMTPSDFSLISDVYHLSQPKILFEL